MWDRFRYTEESSPSHVRCRRTGGVQNQSPNTHANINSGRYTVGYSHTDVYKYASCLSNLLQTPGFLQSSVARSFDELTSGPGMFTQNEKETRLQLTKLGDQYEWTTVVSDKRNEWRKPASYLARTPCIPLTSLVTRGGNRRAFRLPQEGGDHFHCTVEPSPGHIRSREEVRGTRLGGFEKGLATNKPPKTAKKHSPVMCHPLS